MHTFNNSNADQIIFPYNVIAVNLLFPPQSQKTYIEPENLFNKDLMMCFVSDFIQKLKLLTQTMFELKKDSEGRQVLFTLPFN